ncbi:organic cation transporter protein [Halyomorpha halys]|uniref:organic cation transporter protein n=1 Tax=Halyomorpha halys TaxID=286706 RepID=UPI0006D4EBD7|nr:organic cation transporter protein-like [Halyomorpha halys]XP_014287987.1 organic cation transporter protein-like [Halyomorpha halys]XP_024218482.1 organic cation transporter protein-like [Halyomorpha halys]
MDLDDILKELGEFGNYQITIYTLLFFPLALSSMASLSYVFTTGDIEYRCKIPECETNMTSFEEPWLLDALPYHNGILTDRCKRRRAINNDYHENCTSNLFYPNQIEDCHSFIFKTKENTITKEFNLLCEENKWKRTLVGTINNVGTFIGLPLAGILSDRFGRKRVVVTAVVVSSVIATLRSFSMNYIQFIILEFMDALASAGTYVGIFILGIEITGPKGRSLGGVIQSSYYSIGVVILGIVVWLIDDWRIYLRVISLPCLLIISYYWLLPESLRWLMTNKKKDEVFETLKKLSEKNKKPLTENIKKAIEELGTTENMNMDETNEELNNEAKVHPIKQLFRTRIMLLRFLNCSYCWITNTFVFYGLSLSSVAIAGNKYFNFILVSFIEIPAYVITWLVIDVFGRKTSLSMSLVISGISCTMFHFIDADMQTIRLLLYLAGKCAITISFTVLYVCASEMFPTTIRNSLMGFCSTLGRFGSMIAPQMPLLAAYVDPVLIFGAASFVAASLALYFPETLNCKMPDTIEEAEMLGREKTKESS